MARAVRATAIANANVPGMADGGKTKGQAMTEKNLVGARMKRERGPEGDTEKENVGVGAKGMVEKVATMAMALETIGAVHKAWERRRSRRMKKMEKKVLKGRVWTRKRTLSWIFQRWISAKVSTSSNLEGRVQQHATHRLAV